VRTKFRPSRDRLRKGTSIRRSLIVLLLFLRDFGQIRWTEMRGGKKTYLVKSPSSRISLRVHLELCRYFAGPNRTCCPHPMPRKRTRILKTRQQVLIKRDESVSVSSSLRIASISYWPTRSFLPSRARNSSPKVSFPPNQSLIDERGVHLAQSPPCPDDYENKTIRNRKQTFRNRENIQEPQKAFRDRRD